MAKALFDHGMAAVQHAAGPQQPQQPAGQQQQQQAQESVLYVDGFDAEQIWLQLDQAAGPALKRVKRLLKRAGEEPQLLAPGIDEELQDLLEGTDGEISDEEQLQDGSEEASEEEPAVPTPAKTAGAAAKRRTQPGHANEGLLPSEDRFLRLDDMEAFVQDAERAAFAEEDAPGGDGLLGADLTEQGNEAAGDESEDALELGAASDNEGDSSADLDALVEQAQRAAGRPVKQRQRKRRRGADSDADEVDDGIMYADFFGPGSGARYPKQADEEAAADEAADASADDDDAAAARLLGMEQPSDEEPALSDDAEMEAEDAAAAEDADVDDDMGLFGQHAMGAHGSAATDAADAEVEADDALALEQDAADQQAGPLSRHEKRQQRLKERIARLEAENMGEKQWFMRGETDAGELAWRGREWVIDHLSFTGQRPLNSALELDLDFDRQVRPPPQPTEEATASLEELIRRRIADQRFDDPPKVVPPPTEKKRKEIDMDDQKSKKGLGELYEEQYVAAATGVTGAPDKQEPVRQQAARLMRELFAKLDALSNFHYAPKPVLEELTVREDVPALAMEEAAPQVISEASMRAPEEVFQSTQHGAPRAAEELTREQRRQARAKQKRGAAKQKGREAQKKRATPVQAGGEAVVAGRKSASAAAVVEKAAKRRRKGHGAADEKPAKGIDYTKSGAVFKQLQEQRDAAAAGQKLPKLGAAAAGPKQRSTALKL